MCGCIHVANYTLIKVNENPRFSGASPRTPDIFMLGKNPGGGYVFAML
jgi:hypothetical protein